MDWELYSIEYYQFLEGINEGLPFFTIRMRWLIFLLMYLN